MSSKRERARSAPPRPPDGLKRGHVAEMQRARLLAAAGQVACEHGAGDVTVAQIVQRAGVSRRTFYELFTDCEDCVLAALAGALERAQLRVLPAWRSGSPWVDRLRDCLIELLWLFDEEPVLARLLIVESLGAGRRVLEQRSRVLDALVDAVCQGQAPTLTDGYATRLQAEGAMGGVLAVLHTRISQPADGQLVQLAGPLMGMLVLPHRGAAAARRELTRSAPSPSRPHDGDPPLQADPFKSAGMRLTYRTMRVLKTIAEHPGSSNRLVGDLAGMRDQGQTSKLLGRLERLGLIVNKRQVQSRSEPNVWLLTAVGQQVIDSIRVHTHDTSGNKALASERDNDSTEEAG